MYFGLFPVLCVISCVLILCYVTLTSWLHCCLFTHTAFVLLLYVCISSDVAMSVFCQLLVVYFECSKNSVSLNDIFSKYKL